MRVLSRIACVVAALLLSAAAKPAPRGIDPALVGEVKVEGNYRWAIVANMSPYEVWHSSDTIILSPVGALIRYMEFDFESAPRDGEWIAQGLVLVGTGDIKMQPVAIKLWSRDRVRLQGEISHALSLERKQAIAIFTPSLVECKTQAECGPDQFRFTSNAAGEVFVGSTMIGSIK
jgi:hypothetical protein